MDWNENDNGNYVCCDADDLMTVYQVPSGEWCGRNSEWRLKSNYDKAEEAMEMMERLANGDYSIAKRVKDGWQMTTDANYYRRCLEGILSIRKAKSGKWYVCLDGKHILKDRWFDSLLDSKEVVDRLYSE